MADAPLSRRERRALEEAAAGVSAARPFDEAHAPEDAPLVDPNHLSRRDRRRLERLNNPMETWTAEEEMIATGQIPVLTPERIAEQEKLAREKAEKAAHDALLASQEFRVVTPEDLAPRHPARPEAFPEPQAPSWQPAGREQEPVEPVRDAFEPPAELTAEPVTPSYAPEAFAPPATADAPASDVFAPPAAEPAREDFAAPWAQRAPDATSPSPSFWAPPTAEPARQWRQQDLESTWTVTSPSNDAEDDWDPFGEREVARQQVHAAEPAESLWTPPAAPESFDAEPDDVVEPADDEPAGADVPADEASAQADSAELSQDEDSAPAVYTPTFDFADDVRSEAGAEAPSLSVPVLGEAEPDVADDREARARLFSGLFAGQVPTSPADDAAVADAVPAPVEESSEAAADTSDAAAPVEEALSGADEIRRLAEEAMSGLERASGSLNDGPRPATWGEVVPASEPERASDEWSEDDDSDLGDTIAVAPRESELDQASLGQWSPADWAAQPPLPAQQDSARWGEPVEHPTRDPEVAEEADPFSWAEALAASSGDVPQVQQRATPAWGAVTEVPAQPEPSPVSEAPSPAWHPLEAAPTPVTDVNDFTPVAEAPRPDFSQLYQTGQIPPVSGGVTPASGQLPTAGQFPAATGAQPTVAFPGVGTPAGGVPGEAGYTTDVTATGSIRRLEVPTQPEAREFKWLHLGVIGALVFVLGVVIYNVTMNG